MQKKMLAVTLAALLLTVGCAKDPETSVEPPSAVSSFVESVPSTEGAVSLPQDLSSQEESADTSSDTSSEVIELPEVFEFVLCDSLRFCPDGEWLETEEHVYASSDGMCSVRADTLTLPDPKNITEALLVADAVQTLPDGLAQTGAEILSLESVSLVLFGSEHPAVSLATAKDGKTVYQQQIYLLDGADVLLLTVRTQDENKCETLWSYFKKD